MSEEMNDTNFAKSVDEANLLTPEDFRALANTGRYLSKEPALDQLLQNILQTASQLTDSPETSIILRNEHEPTLYFAAATGDEADCVLSTFGIHSEKQVLLKTGNGNRTRCSLIR